jgi:hypothetical protein
MLTRAFANWSLDNFKFSGAIPAVRSPERSELTEHKIKIIIL